MVRQVNIRRQINRSQGRSVGAALKQSAMSEAELEKIKALHVRTMFESVVERVPPVMGPDLDERALVWLKDFYDVTGTPPSEIANFAKGLDEWPEYKNEQVHQYAQASLLHSKLTAFAWKMAEVIVADRSVPLAALLEKHEGAVAANSVRYAIETSMLYMERNRGNRRGAIRFNLGSEAFWTTVYDTCGGAYYFLRLAVAQLIVADFCALDSMFAGSECDHTIFDLDYLPSLLAVSAELWTPTNQSRVAVICALSPDMRSTYLTDLSAQLRAQDLVFKCATAHRDTAAYELRLAEKEAAGLRKRVATAESSLAQLQSANRSLQDTLRAAQKVASPQPLKESDRQVQDLKAQIREQNAQLQSARESLERSRDEIQRFREFFDVVMQPSREAVDSAGALPVRDPSTWRVVFVGGHERLHEKLRKQMRNAVFLHPDRSHFAPEVFAGADAVVFSIGYCSHALTYRAANEVRRLGLRAGYSNFSNVELVLEEVRAILFPKDEDRMAQAA